MSDLCPLLSKFASTFRSQQPPNDVGPQTLIAHEGDAQLFFVPFEHVNRHARLVLVGISPGPTQVRKAYRDLPGLLRGDMALDAVSAELKRRYAFDGMREKIAAVLNWEVLRLAEKIGAESGSSIWGADFPLIQPTSLIPQSAYLRGRYVNAPFDELMDVPVFRKCFEEGFAAQLRVMSGRALFLAFGPTPWAALKHCVDRGLIKDEQLLGYTPHPSNSAGNQFSVFLGTLQPEALKPGNPVRSRVPKLLAARKELQSRVRSIFG